MLHSAQLLTAPISLADYKPKDITTTARSLISSSFLLLQVDRELAREEARMAEYNARPSSRSDQREELWFSMPSNVNREQERSRGPEESAYQATSNRHSVHRSLSPSRYPPVPSICTTTDVNKPLPPSPEAGKKKRGPASIRSLIHRRPSSQLDPNHLQPEPYQQHHRSNSAYGTLIPDPAPYYYPQQSSRSMPSSPATYAQNIPPPVVFARAQSAAAHYDSADNLAHPQQRAVSMNTFFEPGPTRTRVRTFPESSTPSSATVRESYSDRPRPHTWLSPTEPFEDASDFHLFVEATSGFADGALEVDTMSPNGRPRLQGSLFSRGRQNDVIPLPMQYAATSQTSQFQQPGSWQAISYDYMPPQPSQSMNSQLVSSSALPRPDSFHQSQLTLNMNGINLELERLGLDDNEGHDDDELPDYAQSQAEMSEKRRAEATNRAKELEARWNNSRGGRGR